MPTVENSVNRMQVLHVHRAQSEYDGDTISVLVIGAYTRTLGTCTRCKTSGTDRTVSFNDFRRSAHPSVHYTQDVDGQHLIGFRKIFESL
jgi:hypothetical protein